MSAERMAAQKEFDEKLTEVRQQLDDEKKAHQEEVAAVLTKEETARKLCEERAEAERLANVKLKQLAEERAAAEDQGPNKNANVSSCKLFRMRIVVRTICAKVTIPPSSPCLPLLHWVVGGSVIVFRRVF